MKTNQVMIRPMGQFKVEQRTKDAYFNATALLRQWNKTLGTEYTIKDFVEKYIPETARGLIVDIDTKDTYLPIALESQLRLHIANYDMELYDKLDPEVSVWCLSLPLADSSNGPKPLSKQTYLMLDEVSGAVKIGRANNPQFRERTLGVQIPRIRLIAVCADDIENMLHNKYKSKRMRGEWFNLSQVDVADIIKRYGFEKKINTIL